MNGSYLWVRWWWREESRRWFLAVLALCAAHTCAHKTRSVVAGWKHGQCQLGPCICVTAAWWLVCLISVQHNLIIRALPFYNRIFRMYGNQKIRLIHTGSSCAAAGPAVVCVSSNHSLQNMTSRWRWLWTCKPVTCLSTLLLYSLLQ